jgi:pimeloyl-ACP methyl ester carboxylesterase
VCLLLHGLGDASHVWNGFASALASDVALASFDFRGHGDSGWDSDARYDVHSNVADLLYVIETMKWRRIVLVGHSMGGEVALRASASCAERVAGMVLVDFGPDLTPAGVRQVRVQLRGADRTYQSTTEYALWLQAARPLAHPRLVHDFAAYALRGDPSGGLRLKSDPALSGEKDCNPEREEDSDAALWGMLKKTQLPVFLIRGAGSAVLSRKVVDQMLEVLPNASFVTVPSAGHAVMMDNPKGFTDAVRPFVTALLDTPSASIPCA